MSKFPQRWMTVEEPARYLTAKGVSGIDPDCLVAYVDGDDKPLWIVHPGGYVCGIENNGREVRAVRLEK